jgi:hypothetical protein
MYNGVEVTSQEARGVAHGRVRPASVPLGATTPLLLELYQDGHSSYSSSVEHDAWYTITSGMKPAPQTYRYRSDRTW